MSLYEILSTKREEALGRWFELIMDTYPVDAAAHLKAVGKTSYTNPIGESFRQGTGALYDLFLRGAGGPRTGAADALADEVLDALQMLVRIRAVQEFPPSEGIGFMILLKRVVRDLAGATGAGPELLRELMEFEDRVDSVSMAAMDLYVTCVKRLYEIRAEELRRAHHMLIRKVNEA